MCMYGPHVCLVPVEGSRGQQILWNWSYRQLRAVMCLMGTESESSVRQQVLLTAALLSSPYTNFSLPSGGLL